jgi:predicted component of type VI protein secretion system
MSEPAMFSRPSLDSVLRLRRLLECLEKSEDLSSDLDTIELIKSLVRSHLAAIEAVQALASEAPETPQE